MCSALIIKELFRRGPTWPRYSHERGEPAHRLSIRRTAALERTRVRRPAGMMQIAELHIIAHPLPLRLGSGSERPLRRESFSTQRPLRGPPAALIPRFLWIPRWPAQDQLSKCYDTLSCNRSSLCHEVCERVKHSWLDALALERHKRAKKNRILIQMGHKGQKSETGEMLQVLRVRCTPAKAAFAKRDQRFVQHRAG
jgi:hypothetical protein